MQEKAFLFLLIFHHFQIRETAGRKPAQKTGPGGRRGSSAAAETAQQAAQGTGGQGTGGKFHLPAAPNGLVHEEVLRGEPGGARGGHFF